MLEWKIGLPHCYASNEVLTVEMRSAQNEESENWRYVVTFLLDLQTYAVPIESVIKISEFSTLMPTAGGITNNAMVIGMVERQIPIVNLRRNRNTSENPVAPHTPVLTVQIGDLLVAMIVDKIIGVLRLPANVVARAAEMLPGTIMPTPRGIALLLNLPNLFTTDQIRSLKTFAPPALSQEPAMAREM
jgi:chemotaxis signal transduction protein